MVDYLRDYPFDPAPESWGLNDVFLDILREKEALWKQHGLVWTLGTEREFLFFTPQAARQYLKDTYKTEDEAQIIKADPQLAVSFNMLREIEAREYPDAVYQLAAQRCLDDIKRRSGFITVHSGHRRASEQRDFLGHILTMEERLPDEYRREVALAYMHLFDEKDGGVADLIEYRFGPGRHGKGWYDCGDIVELRTPPVKGAVNSIEQSQRILWGIKRAALQFGLVPVLSGGPVQPHVHFSFQIADKKKTNYTAFGDTKTQEFMLRALRGYLEMAQSAPELLTDDLPDELVRAERLKILPSRAATLRVCEDNIEVRLEISHLARNVALLIAGCSLHAFGPAAQGDSENNSGIAMTRYLVPSKALEELNSSFASSLKNCRVEEDGSLAPDPDTVLWNMQNMQKLLAGKPEDTVYEKSPFYDDGPFTLAQWQGWATMFAQMKYDGGRIHAGDAPPEIVRVLQGAGAFGLSHRPYFYKEGGQPSLTSKKIEHNRGLLREMFGQAHGTKVADFYEEADRRKRMKAAAEKIDGILADASDLDRPVPDVIESIYGVLQSSLMSVMQNNRVGADIYVELTLLDALVRQKLQTLAAISKTKQEEGHISNIQSDLLAAFEAEAMRPFEDLSRYTVLLVRNLAEKLEAIPEINEEMRSAFPALTYALVMPFSFYIFINDEPLVMIDRIADQFAKEFDAFEKNIAEDRRDIWARCRQWALNHTELMREQMQDQPQEDHNKVTVRVEFK